DLASEDLGRAVAGVAVAALCRHHDVGRRFRKRTANRLFALAAGIEMGGVDHLDAGVDRGADERDVFAGVAKPIRAETDPAEVGLSKADARRSCHETRGVYVKSWHQRQFACIIPAGIEASAGSNPSRALP